MNDPPRLRHGRDALIAGLLDAGRREEPSPELVARVLRSAAVGVGAGLMATHAGATSSLAAGGSAGATTAGAAAGGGAASAGAAAGGGASIGAAGAGAASAGVAGAGLIKTGIAGVTLAKWVGTGIVGLSLATGVPKVLHWGEQRPSAPSTPRAAEPLAASAPEHAMRPAHRTEPVALPDAPTPVAAVAPAPVAAAPLVAPTPVAPEALATATRRAHAPMTAPRRSRTSAGSLAGTSAHTLGVELQMVDSARAALQRGDAARALEQLRSYEHDAPERQLRLEVAMLRMEAHAALGDMPRARALAAAIVAQPVSPLHAARAREILNSAEAER